MTGKIRIFPSGLNQMEVRWLPTASRLVRAGFDGAERLSAEVDVAPSKGSEVKDVVAREMGMYPYAFKLPLL